MYYAPHTMFLTLDIQWHCISKLNLLETLVRKILCFLLSKLTSKMLSTAFFVYYYYVI